MRLRCAGRRPVAGEEPGSERREQVLMSAADAEVAARDVREPSGGSDEKSSILASCELPEAETERETRCVRTLQTELIMVEQFNR